MLDTAWSYVGRQLPEDVRAVLLKKQDNPGCVRVVANQQATRYTLTEKIHGTVLVAAHKGESIIILGQISVRCFRRAPRHINVLS